MLTEEIKKIIRTAVDKGFNDDVAAEIAKHYETEDDKDNFLALLTSLTKDEFEELVLFHKRSSKLKAALTKRLETDADVITLAAKIETDLGTGYSYTLGMANITADECELILCSDKPIASSIVDEVLDRFAGTGFPKEVFVSDRVGLDDGMARFKLIELDRTDEVINKLFHISLPEKVKRAKKVFQLYLPDGNNLLPGEEGYTPFISQDIDDYLVEEKIIFSHRSKQQ